MAGNKPRTIDSLMSMHADQTAEGKDAAAPIFLRPNTFAHYLNAGFDVYFYDTRIARVYGNGSVTIWSGGVRTATTKNRINDFLLPLRHELVQINHNWHVRDLTTYRLRDFVDGMTIEQKD